MESLEVLDLTDNCVSSTSALCQMTWLKELHIAGNDLTEEQIDELLIYCQQDPKWVLHASDLELLQVLMKCKEELDAKNAWKTDSTAAK